MSELRRWFLAAGLAVTVAAMGCGDDAQEVDADAEVAGEPAPDMGPDVEPPPPPNIGEWCDPTLSDAEGNNATCVGGARCMGFNVGTGTVTEGMCVVYGCTVENLFTGAAENCRALYGLGYRCVDVNGMFSDDGESYDAEENPAGKNADTSDNVCVPTCVPSATANDCNPEFACTALSTAWGWPNTVCIQLACSSDEDCAVASGDSCVLPTDCVGAGEFCDLNQDLNNDGVYDSGTCSLPGNCDATTGTCKPHSHGIEAAAVGDPCKYDTDCPVGGTCLTEDTFEDSQDRLQTVARNGYCTIFGCKFPAATGAVCPDGSICHNAYFAGACFDECDPEDPMGCRENATRCDVAGAVTTDCDWYGDFECTDRSRWRLVGNLSWVSGGSSRICEFTTSDCEQISRSFPDDRCGALAPTGNPAGMGCYDRESGVQLSDTDAAGRCLDATVAGDVCSNLGGFNSDDVCE